MGCAAAIPRCSPPQAPPVLVLNADDSCVMCMETVEDGPHEIWETEADEPSATIRKKVAVRQGRDGGPWLRLDCGHACHLHCLKARVDACKPGQTERLTFGHLTCAICRADVQITDTNQERGAKAVDKLLREGFQLRAKVKTALHRHAREDLIDKIADLPEDEAEAEALIERKLGAFHCTHCRNIFCESIACGTADADAADVEAPSKVCQDCAIVKRAQQMRQLRRPVDFSRCKEPIYKCDLCCSVAAFRCQDFYQCEAHHNGAKTLVMCPGGDKCPLGVEHPQNAHKRIGFIIGCGCGHCK